MRKTVLKFPLPGGFYFFSLFMALKSVGKKIIFINMGYDFYGKFYKEFKNTTPETGNAILWRQNSNLKFF